jgi:hypothetical protein
MHFLDEVMLDPFQVEKYLILQWFQQLFALIWQNFSLHFHYFLLALLLAVGAFIFFAGKIEVARQNPVARIGKMGNHQMVGFQRIRFSLNRTVRTQMGGEPLDWVKTLNN